MDSAVAAALLVEQGYEVVAVMLKLWAEAGAGDTPGANRCCLPEAAERARRVADLLGIPFYFLNAEAPFEARVVRYFIAEYAAGRTPNPCVHCNRLIRFDFLLRRALAMGAEFLATGHYARIRRVGNQYQLLRGRDRRKDQSYFLHTLTQEQLAHLLLPVGELTKEEVRAAARRLGLPVAEQPESQDLCFLATPDYRDFLARRAPHLFRPGPIRDSAGNVLGQHRGLAGYTIGQRKGLGIAASRPLYVLALDVKENALIVGPANELGRDTCLIEAVHYIDGEPRRTPFHAEAEIRYHGRVVQVTVTPLDGDRAQVHFASPQRDITPGQFLVLYDGETVLGGGVICNTP
ncbi:MAG: tRNA 2-thiouridine(34) synthase MnmA [Anaerolineae bacterium]|nr:tRNA 2-thiouridine(34) synthase MnmA [Anaerolineae bacterium]